MADSFRITVKFKNSSSDELNLYSISVDEDSDTINVITNIRQPALKR